MGVRSTNRGLDVRDSLWSNHGTSTRKWKSKFAPATLLSRRDKCCMPAGVISTRSSSCSCQSPKTPSWTRGRHCITMRNDTLDDDRSTNSSDYGNVDTTLDAVNSGNASDDDDDTDDANRGHKRVRDATRSSIDDRTSTGVWDEEAIQKSYQTAAAATRRRKTTTQWATEQVQTIDAWLPRIPLSFPARLDPIVTTFSSSSSSSNNDNSAMIEGHETTTNASVSTAKAAAYSRALIRCYLDLCRDVVGTSIHPLDALHQMQVVGTKASSKQALQHLRHVSCRDPYLEAVLGVERAQRLLRHHAMDEATATTPTTTADSATAPSFTSTVVGTTSDDHDQPEREATFDSNETNTSTGSRTPPNMTTPAQSTLTAAIVPDDAQWEQELSRQVAHELAERQRQRASRRVIESDDEDDDELEFTNDNGSGVVTGVADTSIDTTMEHDTAHNSTTATTTATNDLDHAASSDTGSMTPSAESDSSATGVNQ